MTNVAIAVLIIFFVIVFGFVGASLLLVLEERWQVNGSWFDWTIDKLEGFWRRVLR